MKNAVQDSRSNLLFCNYFEAAETVGLTLMIDATERCQLGCRYCYFGQKGSQNMNVDNVFSAAKNLTGVFGSKLSRINFHYMGGEPLLAWEEILILNEMAKRYFSSIDVDFVWSLTSNLVALDQEKTDHMVREKAGIHCSIDGPEEIHNRNRPYMNGGISFSDVKKNIPLALQITPRDTARVTVCPDDVEHMPEIAETILNLGFKTVGLFPVYNTSWNHDSTYRWSEGIFNALESVGDVKKIHTMIKPARRRPKNSFAYCGASKGLWALDLNGMLYFCHHLTRLSSFKIVDAAHSTSDEIRAAIEASQLPPFEQKLNETCIVCSAKDYCNGGCWVDNLLANNNSSVHEETGCELKRATVSAFSRYFDANPAQLPSQQDLKMGSAICFFRCDKCDEECQSCDIEPPGCMRNDDDYQCEGD